MYGVHIFSDLHGISCNDILPDCYFYPFHSPESRSHFNIAEYIERLALVML